MGKPRLIILVRHGQSEGNKNKEVHQMIPDHRVKLTEEGWRQAEEAGRRLRNMLRPDDTLQIFTSPYRRTRETTEGMVRTLTAAVDPDDPHAAPSPLSRSKIKIYEEPRLREQDFGNFQPCSAEMQRMWQERADYGHFFYRIPNGESAADAYDRVAGFNDSLWRRFSEEDFPSVCVLVTHGLMTRVFLMKWYHWSVEYFEDLRNVTHCEFILMEQNPNNGKYTLQTRLRTWSDLRRQKAEQQKAEVEKREPQRRNTLSAFLKDRTSSPGMPSRKWGGCVEGCNHRNDQYPRRKAVLEKEAAMQDIKLPPAATGDRKDVSMERPSNEKTDGPISTPQPPNGEDKADSILRSSSNSFEEPQPMALRLPLRTMPSYIEHGRDGGGTTTGANTPLQMSDEEEYFASHIMIEDRHASRSTTQKPLMEGDLEGWTKDSEMERGLNTDGSRHSGLTESTSESDDASKAKELVVAKEEIELESSGHVEEDIREAGEPERSLRGSVC